MNIRKERTHHMGESNLDFRCRGEPDKRDHFRPTLKYADFGTMTKTKYERMPSAATFKEQVALSGGWLNSKYQNESFRQSRYETANDFYKSKGKKCKGGVVAMAKKADPALEDTKWTDKVFTGDTQKNTAALTFHAR